MWLLEIMCVIDQGREEKYVLSTSIVSKMEN